MNRAQLEGALQRSQNPYDELPEGVKAIYSQEEYLWLPDEHKKNLTLSECMPDVIE